MNFWEEPAKLRPEFKIQNHKVYIPNLFAKINGVAEDLDDYWQDLKVLSSAPNTKLIVYDNHKDSFNESDIILLAYFNLIGLDVLVFTPTNYQTLEQSWQTIVKGIKETKAIQDEMRQKRQDGARRLEVLKQDFVNRGIIR